MTTKIEKNSPADIERKERRNAKRREQSMQKRQEIQTRVDELQVSQPQNTEHFGRRIEAQLIDGEYYVTMYSKTGMRKMVSVSTVEVANEQIAIFQEEAVRVYKEPFPVYCGYEQ